MRFLKGKWPLNGPKCQNFRLRRLMDRGEIPSLASTSAFARTSVPTTLLELRCQLPAARMRGVAFVGSRAFGSTHYGHVSGSAHHSNCDQSGPVAHKSSRRVISTRLGLPGMRSPVLATAQHTRGVQGSLPPAIVVSSARRIGGARFADSSDSYARRERNGHLWLEQHK